MVNNEHRLKKLRPLLQQHNIDAVIITNPINLRYLSGFDGTSAVLLIGASDAGLITDFRYTEQAAAQAGGFTIYRREEDLYKTIADIIKKKGWGRLAFEAKHVTFAEHREMAEKLPAELIPINESAESLRLIKSAAELELIGKGAAITADAFDYICSAVKPGLSEKELGLGLEMYLRRRGAEEKSFRYIVASGVRGAMPHGTASAKIMERGELVTIDYGAVFEGYATDMTRTVALGEPGKKRREIYAVVQEAQHAAAEALRPGIAAREVDGIARRIIEEHGYGDYFGHGLGHGVGLETHELPVLNKQSDTVLKPGMVVTVEPGIYIGGFGGVRIEDMLAVTENGADVLTEAARDLVVIQ
ncbi:MAG TPA: aminopeptidase P family protein [Firmicutes bacterium]|nr:aminopeptidase P family protein [Bacillota bacterium]